MQISRLSETIKKPVLYKKGNAGMWEDDHISRHLLELHLDPDCDAASRKRSTIETTVQWIETHLDNDKKSILDLGCGPGLYCELLAEHGHRVTGVDFSKRSLDYARQNATKKRPDDRLSSEELS
ncbi:class I SAM-dependent methyltransferase [Methanoregula sp.]|uniref:class I SAM-dependent methyltransferase n=1 Tax=Methanoregula sp. TaxID=2052170 RepID=UPI00236CA95A|nr:class I SAM-dependent methyltransferase [Methanoregula sp.]MDD1686291.1 class I SAM-dependent methyltransferase [Methanoregula sp.]